MALASGCRSPRYAQVSAILRSGQDRRGEAPAALRRAAEDSRRPGLPGRRRGEGEIAREEGAPALPAGGHAHARPGGGARDRRVAARQARRRHARLPARAHGALRYGESPTLFATQDKREDWHERLGGGVHADASGDWDPPSSYGLKK